MYNFPKVNQNFFAVLNFFHNLLYELLRKLLGINSVVFKPRNTIGDGSAVLAESDAVATFVLNLSRVVYSGHDSTALVELNVAEVGSVSLH